MDDKTRYLKIRKATLISAVIDTLLSIFKVIVGMVGHSQALITDGIHSLSDLLTDFLVIFAAKWGSLSPDEDHPYGHGRIETLGTLIIAVMIILVGVGFGYEALKQIFSKTPQVPPSVSVLIVALVSVGSKEWLYRFTLKKTSFAPFDLGYSNAWHHRSDALTSVIVFVGAGTSMFGVPHADSVAALLVSFFIAKMGIQLIWTGLKELIDTGVQPETLNEIKKCIENTPEVKSIHLLRTRSMGNRIFVDVHILVAHMISVSEGHYIADQVSMRLKKEIEHLKDVTIHVDHEDDEIFSASSLLPSRIEIEKEIREKIDSLPAPSDIAKINLHYISGEIRVEIFIQLKEKETSKIASEYKKAILDIPNVAAVEVWFKS